MVGRIYRAKRRCEEFARRRQGSTQPSSALASLLVGLMPAKAAPSFQAMFGQAARQSTYICICEISASNVILYGCRRRRKIKQYPDCSVSLVSSRYMPRYSSPSIMIGGLSLLDRLASTHPLIYCGRYAPLFISLPKGVLPLSH